MRGRTGEEVLKDSRRQNGTSFYRQSRKAVNMLLAIKRIGCVRRTYNVGGI